MVSEDELAGEVERKLGYIYSLDDLKREEYVGKVIDWIVKMFEDIRLAMVDGGTFKAMRVAESYKRKLDDIDRKATAIACLVYAIKDEYRDKLAPVFIGVLGLV